MWKNIWKAVAMAAFVSGGAFLTQAVEPTVAFADPDDGPQDDQAGPPTSWDEHANDVPDWDAAGGWRPGPDGTWIPPDGGAPVREVPIGQLPGGGGGGYAPSGHLPLPFVAPKGTSCGQMLATSVGGTMDNVVGMSTGSVLGYFGHNVLGPTTGNLVGGVLVHLC